MFMRRLSARTISVRAWLLAGALVAAGSATAAAQGVVVQVNGSAITSFDVEQRIRIDQITENKRTDRGQAIEALIEDKLKLDESYRAGYRVTDANVTDSLERIARGNRKTLPELTIDLERRGIDMKALREKFRAEIAWNSLIAGRTRTTAPTNEEINRIVEERIAAGKAKVTDYLINQVIFIVPLRQPQLASQRQSEAESARTKFDGCENGLPMLRAMKDVAVKQPVSKTSTELNKSTNDILEKTGVGRLSPSFRTEQGIEAMAVCEKKERVDIAGIRTEVENELKNRKSGVTAQSLLKDIRARATIVRR